MDNELRIAILIDADNVSDKYIKIIVDEVANIGIATYKRIYGDWTSARLSSWKNVLLEDSIIPIQQYSYTTGKNATDSAMIIDAMDILYTGKVDGFVLVSSDSDFTRLATRLKEAAMLVIGMGKQQTPKAFVAACSKFKYLDILSNNIEENQEELKKENVATKNPSKSSAKKDDKKKEQAETSQTPLEQVIDSVKKLIDESSDEEGWILASNVGDALSKRYSDFDVRNYGFKKLSEFLEKSGFELKPVQDPNNIKNPSGYLLYVRNKKLR